MASTRRFLQGLTVPNDIWECVIDQCAYDKRLLVRCCLTCRAWERRSRYWLEVAKQRRLLYLSSKDELDTIVAEVSKVPHLGSYVEMISICRRMIFSSDNPSSSPWYHTFPLRLASKLPNVRELILDSKVDTSKMLSSSFSLLRTFRSINRIVLSECRFGTFTDFIRLLLFFPQLVDLALTDITWTSQHNLAHLLGKARSKNFRLRCLTANATRHPEFVTPFMAWLETTPSRDSLEELHLRLHGDGAFHGVATFFKAGAQNLREVSFNVVQGRIAGMHKIYLQNLPSLHSISFERPGIDEVRTLTSILSRMPPSTKKIYIQFRGDGHDGMRHPNWVTLDVSLAAQLRNRDVDFECSVWATEGAISSAVVSEKMYRALPLLSALGLVHAQY